MHVITDQYQTLCNKFMLDMLIFMLCFSSLHPHSSEPGVVEGRSRKRAPPNTTSRAKWLMLVLLGPKHSRGTLAIVTDQTSSPSTCTLTYHARTHVQQFYRLPTTRIRTLPSSTQYPRRQQAMISVLYILRFLSWPQACALVD